MKKQILAISIISLLNVSLSAQGPIDDLSTRKIENQLLRTRDSIKISPIKEGAFDIVEPSQKITINVDDLIKAPDILFELILSALKNHDINSLRMLLPKYKELPPADQSVFITHYASALIAQSDQQYYDAIHHYQTILKESEEFEAIRYPLAQNLFANKAYKDSKAMFITIKEKNNIPEIVDKQINQYLAAIDEVTKPDFNIGFNYLNDNNINGAPPQSQIGDWSLPEPEKAQGLMYSLSAGKDFNIKGNHYLHTMSFLYGEYFWNNKDYNDIIWRTYIGYAYKDAKQSIYLAPYYESRWFGNRSYSHTPGLRIAYDRVLSQKVKVFVSAEYGRLRYDDRKHLNGHQYNISTSIFYAPSEKQFFYTGLDWNKENTQFASDSFNRYGIRAGWGRQWPKDFSTNLQVSYAERKFRAEDIFDIKKRMEEYQINLSIWNRKFSFYKITPKLTFSWQKRHSNHPFYRYDRKKVFLDISRDF